MDAAEGDVKDDVRQLPFSFAVKPPDYTRAGYVVGDANREAIQLLDAWTASDGPALAICGPEGSGKSHLARIIANEVGDGASMRPAATVSPDDIADIATLIVDDAHAVKNAKLLLSIYET